MSDQSLIRIEYKLDLIIRALQDKGLMLQELPEFSGLEDDTCPVCGDKNRLQMDFTNERLTKTCGCRPPKAIVAGISSVLTPPESEEHYGNRAREEQAAVPFDEAEGGDRDGSR